MCTDFVQYKKFLANVILKQHIAMSWYSIGIIKQDRGLQIAFTSSVVQLKGTLKKKLSLFCDDIKMLVGQVVFQLLIITIFCTF